MPSQNFEGPLAWDRVRRARMQPVLPVPPADQLRLRADLDFLIGVGQTAESLQVGPLRVYNQTRSALPSEESGFSRVRHVITIVLQAPSWAAAWQAIHNYVFLCHDADVEQAMREAGTTGTTGTSIV